MRTLLRLCMVAVLACAAALGPASAASAADGPRVLVVTTGTGNTETAEFALERLGMEARRWSFELVEGGPADLADLTGVDAVMFLNTEGDILDAEQRDSLRAFVEGGGGFIGTHSAAVTEPSWDWWQEMIGATAIEPPTTPATKQSISFSGDSPIVEGMDEDLELSERWFYFDPEPSGVEILGQLDSEDPVAWTGPIGRVFYSVAGGEHKTWSDRDFLKLIRQAIWWSVGDEGRHLQNTDDAASPWPYTWTFILFVLAVAGGGSLAVWRLDRTELTGTSAPAA